MDNQEGKDRYNWEHRKDPHHQVGDSMPGTVGDSDGTLHDRLGDMPAIEEDIHEPGHKARLRAEESKTKTSDASVDELDGETTTLELEESTKHGAVGYYDGHQVHVEEASTGDTVLVTLSDKNGKLEGSRIRLRE